ncbi:histidine kinase [candidate division KSB1 bacterium]|nr:histidine kinase [candidate division KSB1 bacterium]
MFKKYRIIRHIIFWIISLAFKILVWGGFAGNYVLYIKKATIDLPIIASATYFTLYFLLPRYLLTKRYKRFWLIFSISAILFTTAQMLIMYFFKYPIVLGINICWGAFEWIKYSIGTLADIYSIVAVATCIKLVIHWYTLEQAKDELQREKLHAELNLLKGQLHPHFLFNTLNNLYALALKQSDKVPEIIIKLSELLDFMLYECNEPTIPLSREIKLIENYSDLERLRYGNKLNVEMDLPESTTGVQIAPLMFMPLVENSFKHGVSTVRNNPYIRLKLHISGNKLHFRIENSWEANGSRDDQGYREGIGLKNLQRRLDLLYGSHYSLSINRENERFTVHLILHLEYGKELIHEH